LDGLEVALEPVREQVQPGPNDRRQPHAHEDAEDEAGDTMLESGHSEMIGRDDMRLEEHMTERTRPTAWQLCEWRARDAVILAIEGSESSPADPPIAMAKSATLAQHVVEIHNAWLEERNANGDG
jgi:hypothetical protein